MQNKTDENNKIRIAQLKKETLKTYEHLAPDEVDILATHYKQSETRMIEVIQVRKKSAFVMDLYEPIEFTHVVFPQTILPLLKRRDVFLATLGLNEKMWEVIYLSPPYNDSAEGPPCR